MRKLMHFRLYGAMLIIGGNCAMFVAGAAIAQDTNSRRLPVADTPAIDAQSQRPARLRGSEKRTLRAIENDKQTQPRRAYLTASTREPIFSAYYGRWVNEIELVGNRKLQELDSGKAGKLIATVSILANGHLEKVEIEQSSGSAVLDEMVKRIAYEAAPFPAFPPEIAVKYGVIAVIATWRFTSTRGNEPEVMTAESRRYELSIAMAPN